MVLRNYKFVPKLDCMLFLVLESIDQGFNASNEGMNIILQHKTFRDIRLAFDWIKCTVDRKLCGVNMTPRAKPNKKEMAMKNEAPEIEIKDEPKEGRKKQTKHWEINRMHQVFNHAGEEVLRCTAKAYGWELTGKLDECKLVPLALGG